MEQVSHDGFHWLAAAVELMRAKPWLARQAEAPASTRSDPNNRPVSREVTAQADSNGVCAWCYEPGDEVSELIETVAHDLMHPECDEAWTVEREAGRDHLSSKP